MRGEEETLSDAFVREKLSKETPKKRYNREGKRKTNSYYTGRVEYRVAAFGREDF